MSIPGKRHNNSKAWISENSGIILKVIKIQQYTSWHSKEKLHPLFAHKISNISKNRHPISIIILIISQASSKSKTATETPSCSRCNAGVMM